MYLRLESRIVSLSQLGKKLLDLPNTLVGEEFSERRGLRSLIGLRGTVTRLLLICTAALI
jgi:hypothetical protein